MTTAAQEALPAKKPASWAETVEVAKTVIYALAIALVLRILLFQPFTIPSASMEPTLLQGDYIIVSKYSYGYSRHSIPFSPPVMNGRVFERAPARGDVVVFKLPRDGHTDYIKRLVGLPGDRIQVLDGRLSVNGRPVPRTEMSPTTQEVYGFSQEVKRFRECQAGGRCYVTYDARPDGEVDTTSVYVVPAGHYFMMGDNRDNSLDSRVPESVGVGFVPVENLVGKAEVILLSWNAEASLFKPWTWLTEARPSRFFTRLR